MALVVSSAPGKVILTGEHAVVHGATALAVSIDLRTFCVVKLETGTAKLTIDLPDLSLSRSWDLVHWKQSPPTAHEPQSANEQEMAELNELSGGDKAFVPLLFLLRGIMDISISTGISIFVRSELPTGAGLGSSAAFSVAVATALLGTSGVLAKREPDDSDRELINKWAYEAERILHGNPSGIDNTTSTYGGAVSLSNRIPKILKHSRQFRVMITNTKVPRSTSILVAKVKENRMKYPAVITPVIDSLGHLSTKCIEILCGEKTEEHAGAGEEQQQQQGAKLTPHEETELSELFAIAHHLLNGLGVGHDALDAVVRISARDHLASKLTGAGGGGCAITLIPHAEDVGKRVERVKEALQEQGFECFECGVAVGGAEIHDSQDPRVVSICGSAALD